MFWDAVKDKQGSETYRELTHLSRFARTGTCPSGEHGEGRADCGALALLPLRVCCLSAPLRRQEVSLNSSDRLLLEFTNWEISSRLGSLLWKESSSISPGGVGAWEHEAKAL